jgi:hypothetical protein
MLYTTVYHLQCPNSHGCPPDLKPNRPRMRSQVKFARRKSDNLMILLNPHNTLTHTFFGTAMCHRVGRSHHCVPDLGHTHVPDLGHGVIIVSLT